MSHLVSLHGLAINLSLLQTLTFQFDLTVHQAHEPSLTILVSQPGVCSRGWSTLAWGSPFPEPPAAAGAHFTPGILEGLSPTSVGRPWHEAVWSRETSGAVVHVRCHWVSRSSLRRLGILSTPFGLLPLWEGSHLRVSHSGVYNQEHNPPSIWAFPLQDKPICLIGVPCWRGELLSDSTQFGNQFICLLRARLANLFGGLRLGVEVEF